MAEAKLFKDIEELRAKAISLLQDMVKPQDYRDTMFDWTSDRNSLRCVHQAIMLLRQIHELTGHTEHITAVSGSFAETCILEVLDDMVEELDKDTSSTQSTTTIDSYLKKIFSHNASGPCPREQLVAAITKKLNCGRLPDLITFKSDPDERSKLLKAEIKKVAKEVAIREAKRQISDRMEGCFGESCFGDQEDSD